MIELAAQVPGLFAPDERVGECGGRMQVRTIDALLAIMCLTLLFQVFPSAFWGMLAILNPRNWSWRSYAGFFAVAIVVLMVLRTWSAQEV